MDCFGTSVVDAPCSPVQVKGTGLANRCPEVGEDIAGGNIIFDSSKNYKIVELCLEPKSWQIEEEVTRKRGDSKLGEEAPHHASLQIFLSHQPHGGSCV